MAACLGLAACGSSSTNSSSSTSTSAKAASTPASTSTPAAASGGGEQLKLAASESGGLKFTKSTLSAKNGTVTITMTNPKGDQLPHGIAIEGNGVDKDGKIVQPGGASTVSVALKPGKYAFYCPVGNHRAQGMEGTLTVQ
jgi:plastocyanin